MQPVQDLIEWILGGLIAVLSFFLKDTHARVATLEKDYNELHKVYVKKDDFKDFKNELWDRLAEIKEAIKK